MCPNLSVCHKKALYRSEQIEPSWSIDIEFLWRHTTHLSVCYLQSNSPTGWLFPTETCRRHSCIKHSVNTRKAVDIFLERSMITPERTALSSTFRYSSTCALWDGMTSLGLDAHDVHFRRMKWLVINKLAKDFSRDWGEISISAQPLVMTIYFVQFVFILLAVFFSLSIRYKSHNVNNY